MVCNRAKWIKKPLLDLYARLNLKCKSVNVEIKFDCGRSTCKLIFQIHENLSKYLIMLLQRVFWPKLKENYNKILIFFSDPKCVCSEVFRPFGGHKTVQLNCLKKRWHNIFLEFCAGSIVVILLRVPLWKCAIIISILMEIYAKRFVLDLFRPSTVRCVAFRWMNRCKGEFSL